MARATFSLLSLLSLTLANHFTPGAWKPAVWGSPSWTNTFDTTVISGLITESQLLFVSPLSVSCWNASQSNIHSEEECTTAWTLMRYINNSFLKYNFTKGDVGATMLYENAGFRMNINHMPKRRGQGSGYSWSDWGVGEARSRLLILRIGEL
ncbi:unnamed protein product [Tuber aestivum]|uniref:Uncharacterized protein n=1 Tax=Tuber aestivum TaxID=59557 RepID=A0A292PYR5_9PEZI|nr:unnamed protein product [Tuber aestivum]